METHHPGRAHENMRRPRTVLAILDRSSQRLRNIAANLEGGRAGWTDQGLEYSLFSSGQRSLGGFAENSWVTFTVEVRPPGFYDEGVLTWEVEAEMAVRCDHPTVDCGMHRIEFREAPDLEDPVRAIAALDEFTSWLVERSANGVGRSSWTVSWTGRPGGSHPRAPTERSVTVSRHSALLISVRRRSVGLDLLARLLPDDSRRPVARANKPRNEPAPSLHPHYRSFPATTSRSASRRRTVLNVSGIRR